MQCINEVFGGKTVRAPVPMHGKTSLIYHNNDGIFRGVCSPFAAARYHSLTVRFSRTELLVTSYSDDGVIMGMSHPELPLHGVQFHPESFLTEYGFILNVGEVLITNSLMGTVPVLSLDGKFLTKPSDLWQKINEEVFR